MKQLTVRGFDPELERHLRATAMAEHVSLNQAALRLMRKGAGLDTVTEAHVVGKSLDHLCGTWTIEEEHQFLQSIESCEEIDASLWK